MMQFLPTDHLAAARLAIIFWTRIAVWPLEIAFDHIEDELEARGVRVDQQIMTDTKDG